MARVIKAKNIRRKPRRIDEIPDLELEKIASSGLDAGRIRKMAVELACAMTERLMEESLILDSNLIDRIYERTVAKLGGLEPVTITVNSKDRAHSKIDTIANANGWKITEDPSVKPGDCIVSSQAVVVNRRLDEAINIFREALEAD